MSNKMVVVAIYDSAVQAYMRPFYARARGEALRMFTDEVNRAADDNPLYKHPEDYSLNVLALFDEVNGDFEPDRQVLARGQDVKSSS